MPRTREQFSQMRDETEASILKVSLPLFSLGSRKVTIDLIAEKAKISHGLVYHYFKNTDEILNKLMKSSTYVELLEKLMNPAEGSNYEKIEEIVTNLLNVSVAKMDKICYLNMILKNTDKNSLYSLLVSLVKNAQKAGQIVGGEPENIVQTIYFLFKGIYLSFLTEKHPNVKVPSVESVMQLIRKPISF